MPETIPATDLLRLSDYHTQAPFTADLIYAQPNHPDNHFPHLYRPDAHLFVHRLLLPVLLEAARLAHARHDWTLCFIDCFRSVEAQAIMSTYGYPHQLVSRPGIGPHPRGLAIDVTVKGVDFGTPFDFFATDLNANPASRAWQHPPGIMKNRAQLDTIMFEAAGMHGLQMRGYPEEWWDYRCYQDFYEQYSPVSEADLPLSHFLTRSDLIAR